MDKQEYFLKKHGIVLDKRRSPAGQNQQMKIGFGVKDIETGDRPYIFISYSHKDSAVVFPAIKALQERGYPVWYDDSIRTGVAWRKHIEERVSNSELVIAFMSENSVASNNCIAEVDHAIDLNLPILTVRLDESPIPSGLNMYLKRDQMFSAYLYDGDTYITRLAAEPIIAETAGAAIDAYNAEKRRAAEEAERKRREEEEAERRRIEAEEAERERKEREEADRRRKEAEAAEELQRQRERVARKRREKQAELERLQEEEAELERQEKEARQSYVDSIELEKQLNTAMAALRDERNLRVKAEEKCQETANLLEMERKKNQKTEKQRSNEQRRIANLEATASKLSRAEKHIAELEAAAKKREEAERITPEMREQKAELVKLYEKVQDCLCQQTYSGYNEAISIFNNEMISVGEQFPSLMPEVLVYKNRINTTLYHDARVMERKRKRRLAYALYDTQADCSPKAIKLRDAIKDRVTSRLNWAAFFVLLTYLAANFLLVKFVYDTEASFWFNTMISVGPMIVMCILWFICNAVWLDSVFGDDLWMPLAVGIVLSSLISLIVCPFLYPEMAIWLRIIASFGYNAVCLVIGFCGSIIIVALGENRSKHNIIRIRVDNP